jgi:hypothetical protein
MLPIAGLAIPCSIEPAGAQQESLSGGVITASSGTALVDVQVVARGHSPCRCRRLVLRLQDHRAVFLWPGLARA